MFRTCCLSFDVPPHLTTSEHSSCIRGCWAPHFQKTLESVSPLSVLLLCPFLVQCFPYFSFSRRPWLPRPCLQAAEQQQLRKIRNGRKHLGKTLTHREQDIKTRSESSAWGTQDLWAVDKNCFYFARVLPLVLLLKNANKEIDLLFHRSWEVHSFCANATY